MDIQRYIDVIGPDGEPSRRRAIARTVKGRALLGDTRFPTGDVEPVPRKNECVHEIGPDAVPRWRMLRFVTARR